MLLTSCANTPEMIDGYIVDLGTYSLPDINNISHSSDALEPPIVCVEKVEANKTYDFLTQQSKNECGLYNGL